MRADAYDLFGTKARRGGAFANGEVPYHCRGEECTETNGLRLVRIKHDSYTAIELLCRWCTQLKGEKCLN